MGICFSPFIGSYVLFQGIRLLLDRGLRLKDLKDATLFLFWVLGGLFDLTGGCFCFDCTEDLLLLLLFVFADTNDDAMTSSFPSNTQV